MSSFFGKEETGKNLQYDDVAFYHFFTSICGVACIVLIYQILTELFQRDTRPIKALKKTGLFDRQIRNQARQSSFYLASKSFWVKFIWVLVLGSLIYFMGEKAASESGNMIGFDPHQILGVQYDSSVSVIKKAYRKLALVYHPDRNPNNPEVGAKFIMISKAYDCLTDAKAIENCKKYGNPDGEQSFKVGIGLPSFVINMEYRFIVLPLVFGLLLLLIPYLFIKWNQSLRGKDDNGLQVLNYELFWNCFTPQFNLPDILVMYASMQEINDYSVKISEQKKRQLLDQIAAYKIIPGHSLAKTPPEALQTLKNLIQYLSNVKSDVNLPLHFEEQYRKLLMFSLQYCKRNHHGKPLGNNQNWPTIFLGTSVLRLMIEFPRRFYNRLFGQQMSCVLELLDLTPEEINLVRQAPTHNIVGDILESQQKINIFVNRFPETNRQYIKKQLQNIPLLELTIEILVEDQPRNRFSTNDTAIFAYTLKRTNQTSGYCALKNFPFLKKQTFYFMITCNGNLMHFQEIQLPGNKNQYKGKFSFQHGQPQRLEFMARVVSDCYYAIDIQCPIAFDVYEAQEIESITFNREDQQIQKMPKTFVQSIFSLEIEGDSDKEFSDDEDEEGGTILNVPFKSNKTRFMQEEEHVHGQNCQHNHDQHQHQNQHQHGQNCQHDHNHEHQHQHGQNCQHEHEDAHNHEDEHEHGNCSHNH